MDISETLKSINAVQILYSEKVKGGLFSGSFFDIIPDWLKHSLDSKKLKPYINRQLDYMCWNIENEYGDKIIFYPYDWIIHDDKGKIYGLKNEIVSILNGKL